MGKLIIKRGPGPFRPAPSPLHPADPAHHLIDRDTWLPHAAEEDFVGEEEAGADLPLLQPFIGKLEKSLMELLGCCRHSDQTRP